jgi:hypothetical protein
MKTKTTEIALIPIGLLKTMLPSAPLALPVPNYSSVAIDLIAPQYRTELTKERLLEDEKRKVEKRRNEQEQARRQRQLSRRAVFNSD